MTAAFTFSVATPGIADRRAWTELVRKVDDLGYDGLALNDHVGQGLEPLTALAAAAMVSERLTLSLRVANLTVRDPVQLADAALSLDALSGGRFELGIGAGWLARDAIATGRPLTSPSVRMKRMAEVVDVLDVLLTGKPIDHRGDQLDLRVDEPLGTPCRAPRLPLLIGGAGERMLTLAATRADTVSIIGASTWDGGMSTADLSASRLDEKVRWIAAAQAARPVPPRRNHVLWECLVTPRPDVLIDAYSRASGRSADQLRSSPALLIGSVQQVAEEVHRRRERWGLTDIAVPADAAETFAAVMAVLRE